MSFTDINGINICYEIHGDGYPVILIHGFSGKKESSSVITIKKVE